MAAPPKGEHNISPAFFIADHVALDFLNSVAGAGDSATEFLTDDEEVLNWLRRAGLLADQGPAVLESAPPGALRNAAVALREAGRLLVERRKAGRQADPAPLNRLLARGGTYRQLVWKAGAPPVRVARQRVESPDDLLVPVAEAIAELVESADFDLVKTCDGPDCTLWFYDRTKSHRRRWCSMSMCGNRMKVAAFRERRRQTR